MKKFLRTIALILVLTLTFGVVAFADGAGGSGDGGNGNKGNKVVKNGASYKKGGFVYYICNDKGEIVAEPSARVAFDRYPDSSFKKILKTRYGGRVVSEIDGSMQDLGIWWQKPPFNENASGNGGYIKNWLLKKSDNGKRNATRFIQQIWGESTAQAFLDNDQYLVVEPFMFSGVFKGDKCMMSIVGTTLGYVQTRERLGLNTTGLETIYSLGNLPNSMAYDIPVLGTPAPSSLNGKHTYDELKSLGYGVIAVWSSEIKESPEPPKENKADTNADSIKSWELNYVYKNFSGSRSGSKDGFEIAKIDMNLFRNHAVVTDTEKDDYIDDYTVTDNKSGDLWSFKGNNVLFYRPANGLWKPSAVAKNFGKDDQTYPQYTYNISRKLWNDDLILCNFKKPKVDGGLSEDTIRTYADSQLGIKSGNTGKVTDVSAGINTDATYGVTKSDSYSFKGSTTEHWKAYEKVGSHTEGEGTENETEVDDFDWVDKQEDIESDTISYSVTHYLDKYKVKDTEVATNKMVQTIPYSNNIIGTRAYNKVASILQANAILRVDPEVKMTMHYTNETETHYDGVSDLQVYVMGEKIRQCQPAVIASWSACFTRGTYMTGKTYVDAPCTGTNAFEWEAKWSRDLPYQDHYTVSAQGSGFETSTTNNAVVQCTTISLDVLDNVNGQPVRSSWRNTYNPLSVHSSFVTAMQNSLDVGVNMKRYTINNAQFGTTDKVDNFDISDSKTSYMGKDQFALIYEDGEVKNKADAIKFIASKLGVSEDNAATVYNNSGIEQELNDMFVTNKDSDNYSANRWYSEDSIAMCLTSHQTNIVFGNIIFNDKNAYGESLDQDAYDKTKNGSTGVQARFYFSLFFNTDVLSFEGFDFDVTKYKYLIDTCEIKGARFLLSNITTHDWLY